MTARRPYAERFVFLVSVGTPEDQTTAFPPHMIVGNVYCVGTKPARRSFLWRRTSPLSKP